MEITTSLVAKVRTTLLVANVLSYLVTFYEYYKTCTSFILLSTFRLLFKCFQLMS